MAGPRHIGAAQFARLSVVLGLLLALGFATGCESPRARALKTRQAALQQSLGALANQGDIDAMRIVADIEVLRSQTMFSDSVANSLTAMPGTAFIALDPKGLASRIERGLDIAELLAFTGEEQGLLKDGVITADDAAEVRRLATDNMSAAADKVRQLRSHRGTGLP